MSVKKPKTTSDKTPFTGVVTALVTPFLRGKVDEKSLRRLVRFQLDGGVAGFVVNGTTGESPTLTWKEVERIFKIVKAEVSGAVPLLIGTGSNCTATTIEKTKAAAKWRADGALVVAPYYNKPPQRGLVAHFAAVAKASKIPVVLYNVPGRTVVSISSETTIALSKIKNIVGIKEASGDLDHMAKLKNAVPKNFLLSSGDDATCMEFVLRGGHGVISVLSHLIPNAMADMVARARSGHHVVTMEYQRYDKLNNLLGIEANPIPVKMALYQMGIIASPELRLPMVALEGENKKLLMNELHHLGLA